MSVAKKLYRSLNERKLAGVCGGLGEFFEIDPNIVRLAAVLLTLAGGAGVVTYIIAWIIVPEEPLNAG
jgi:phage shock protein PspC (stress-responsive transcriptional regulator)